MTDLIQRLREDLPKVSDGIEGKHSFVTLLASDIREAADGIERLTAENERLTNERSVYGRWMYEAMLTLHTLVDEDSEDDGNSLRMLIDRGERLAEAALKRTP